MIYGKKRERSHTPKKLKTFGYRKISKTAPPPYPVEKRSWPVIVALRLGARSVSLSTNTTVWRFWTNAECLLRAHTQRIAISKDMLNYKADNVSKVCVDLGDNASVNPKQNRAMQQLLHGFSNIEIGCRIHCTALVKTRSCELIKDIVTGQTNWALTLNKGTTLLTYKACVKSIAKEWMSFRRGMPSFSNPRGQRQLMSLIFQPHSHVS